MPEKRVRFIVTVIEEHGETAVRETTRTVVIEGDADLATDISDGLCVAMDLGSPVPAHPGLPF